MTGVDRPVAPALARMERWDNVGVVVVLLAGFVACAALDSYGLKLVGRVYALWLAAMGLQLLLSRAGVLTLGHAAFLSVGAYVAGALALQGPHHLASMFLAVIATSAVAGAVIGGLTLRLQGLYQLMATLAMGQMMFYGLQSLRALGGDDGFPVQQRPALLAPLSLDSDGAWAALIVATAGIAAYLIHRLYRSELGVLIQAARDDPRRLASLGTNPFAVQLAAFVTAAVFTGIAGAFMAHTVQFASPQMGHWMISGELMVLVLLGGHNTRLGLFLACVVLVTAQEIVAQYTEHWALVLGALVLARVLWSGRKGAGV